MSCYGWERGQITLPSAQVAPLKKVLREYLNALHAEVRTEAVRIHKDSCRSTRSSALYGQRLGEVRRATYTALHPSPHAPGARRVLVHDLAVTVLERMLAASGTPHQPTVADVERVVPRATNRTESFPVFADGWGATATITFDGRVVTWDVPEGNRSVERARESVTGERFFTALRRIEWTRGTGGVLWGNNEYNEDEGGYGRRADFVTDRFGPIGEQQLAGEMRALGLPVGRAARIARNVVR